MDGAIDPLEQRIDADQGFLACPLAMSANIGLGDAGYPQLAFERHIERVHDGDLCIRRDALRQRERRVRVGREVDWNQHAPVGALGRPLDHEHRPSGFAQEALGRRAEEQPMQPTGPVRTHDEHARCFSGGSDLVDHPPLDEARRGHDAGSSLQQLREFVELLPSIGDKRDLGICRRAKQIAHRLQVGAAYEVQQCELSAVVDRKSGGAECGMPSHRRRNRWPPAVDVSEFMQCNPSAMGPTQ